MADKYVDGYQRVVFCNVDTQYDFIRDDESFRGALAIPGAKDIEGNLEALTLLAKDTTRKVVNTADWHTLNSEEISDNPDFVNTFPPHCIMYTKGAEYIPATAPKHSEIIYEIDWRDKEISETELFKRRNIILYKDKFDIFAGNKHTEKVLELLNPDAVVVYGVATNVCVAIF